MEKIKKLLKTIGYIIVTVLLTIVAVFFVIKHKNTKDAKNKAEKAREDKQHELEEKTADDIAANSPNPDTISANIEREREALRQRIRDRLNKNIHRTGSSGDN